MDLPADLRLRLEEARRQMTDSSRVLRSLTRDAAGIRERIAAEQARWSQANERAYNFLAGRLERQRVVEQAIGILMAEQHCSAEHAHQTLRALALADGVTPGEAATTVVVRAQGPVTRAVGKNGRARAAPRQAAPQPGALRASAPPRAAARRQPVHRETR